MNNHRWARHGAVSQQILFGFLGAGSARKREKRAIRKHRGRVGGECGRGDTGDRREQWGGEDKLKNLRSVTKHTHIENVLTKRVVTQNLVLTSAAKQTHTHKTNVNCSYNTLLIPNTCITIWWQDETLQTYSATVKLQMKYLTNVVFFFSVMTLFSTYKTVWESE